MSIYQHCSLWLTALTGKVQIADYPQTPFGAKGGEAVPQPRSDAVEWAVRLTAALPPE